MRAGAYAKSCAAPGAEIAGRTRFPVLRLSKDRPHAMRADFLEGFCLVGITGRQVPSS